MMTRSTDNLREIKSRRTMSSEKGGMIDVAISHLSTCRCNLISRSEETRVLHSHSQPAAYARRLVTKSTTRVSRFMLPAVVELKASARVHDAANWHVEGALVVFCQLDGRKERASPLVASSNSASRQLSYEQQPTETRRRRSKSSNDAMNSPSQLPTG